MVLRKAITIIRGIKAVPESQVIPEKQDITLLNQYVSGSRVLMEKSAAMCFKVTRMNNLHTENLVIKTGESMKL